MSTKIRERGAWGKATGIAKRAKAIVEDYRKAVAKTNAQDYYTQETRTQRVRELKEEARERLAKVLVEGEAAHDEVLSQVTAMITPTPTDSTEELLWETKRLRAWPRVRERLEYAITSELEDVVLVAREEALLAAGKGDIQMLQALREEVPTFLRARGYGSLSDAAARVIETEYRKTLDETQMDALLVRDELGKAWSRALTGHSLAKSALDEPIYESVVVADYDGSILMIEAAPVEKKAVLSSALPSLRADF